MADRKSQIVVEGEASESDSDPEEVDVREGVEPNPPAFHHDLPPPSLTSRRSAPPTPGGHLTSLLQLKLQESNARLCADLGRSVGRVFLGAARDVRAAAAHLSQAQGAVAATSHTVRVAVDDLAGVCEKIDIITACRLLPDINMADSATAHPAGRPPV